MVGKGLRDANAHIQKFLVSHESCCFDVLFDCVSCVVGRTPLCVWLAVLFCTGVVALCVCGVCCVCLFCLLFVLFVCVFVGSVCLSRLVCVVLLGFVVLCCSLVCLLVGMLVS